jgi:hypothetical protein
MSDVEILTLISERQVIDRHVSHFFSNSGFAVCKSREPRSQGKICTNGHCETTILYRQMFFAEIRQHHPYALELQSTDSLTN